MVAIVLLSADRHEAVAGIILAATRHRWQSRRKLPCSPHQGLRLRCPSGGSSAGQSFQCRLQLVQPSGQDFHGLDQVVFSCGSIFVGSLSTSSNLCLQFRCVFRQLACLHKGRRFPQTELSANLSRCYAENETRDQLVL
ncbi:hypothetical protein T11_8229 [Trichinella zimbabwensis]|uniref:Uncharacterized protein n=1 Tax=Trichinella zimbabwensis TaxID=268475 RepID=A0A0V1GW64_9BILA|nr:hypothetical protein T11_8229 [Trichinella zimbabwensis]